MGDTDLRDRHHDNDLHDRLAKLLPAQMDRLVRRLQVPRRLLLGDGMSMEQRAIELVRYFEQAPRTREQLAAALDELLAEAEAPPPDDLAPHLPRYRAALLEEHGRIVLHGFKTRLRVPIDLEELYVPLRAMVDLRPTGEARFADARDAEDKLGAGSDRSDEVPLLDSFREAFHRRRRGLVILGDPGSGKTTHLRRLVVSCLKDDPSRLGLDPRILPVFLPLRRLEAGAPAIAGFIEREVDAQLGLAPGFGRRLLERGRLLLLFDGLDEVPDPARRAEVARFIEKVSQSHPTCVPVVTCRFAGYGLMGSEQRRDHRREIRLDERFLELHIRPLTPEAQQAFIRNWYFQVKTGLARSREAGEAEARAGAEALIADLARPDNRTTRVAEMLGNPLLLANLCLVHHDSGRLPRGRGRLYAECIEVLLERWREGKNLAVTVDAETGQRVLQPVAAWMHEARQARAGTADLAPIIEPVLRTVRWTGGDAAQFLARVRDDSGLLVGWGPEEFGFMHLGLQEYLVASELRRRILDLDADREAELAAVAAHYGDSWWQEVLLLLAGMTNPSVSVPLLRAIVERPEFAKHSSLRALFLEEASEVSEAPLLELLRRPPGKDKPLWRRQRAALDMLREIGADRTLAMLAAELAQHPAAEIRRWASERVAGAVLVTEKGGVELVPIPGGTFVMGSPEDEVGRYDDEVQHEVTVSPFLIGRYAVTNEQYGRYLKESPDVQSPRYWSDRRYNQASQPVVGVSWDEASAFAAWAGCRLPTEAEWEYACRAGTVTATYSGNLTSKDHDPVLDGIAWYAPNTGAGPKPVGQKAPNRYGLFDMLGNVFEWCADWYSTYARKPATDPTGPRTGSHRVSRGGSWRSFAHYARGALRSFDSPGICASSLGFRLARGQAPSR